jgi:nucleotide-binding universal stress UspA family protein
MLTVKTILHPTDFSEHSENAYQLACSLARDYDARLILLHVVPPPVAHGEVMARQQPDGYYEQLEKELIRLQQLNPRVRIERRLEDGDPEATILEVAEEVHCDLIVMGTHGRTGLGRLLMGSVAEAVLRQAPCPVLTVKTPIPEDRPSGKPIPQTTGKSAGEARL